MSRAPFQVLILPYTVDPDGTATYAVFQREESTGGYWQALAGGGEAGETPLEAARREAEEEAGISPDEPMIPLETRTSVPTEHFPNAEWADELDVIPEYAFAVRVDPDSVRLSDEHVEHRWVPFEDARGLLRWDSNRTALWELHRRLAREG